MVHRWIHNWGQSQLGVKQIEMVLLMIKILHYLKDPKLWELWYIPYYG